MFSTYWIDTSAKSGELTPDVKPDVTKPSSLPFNPEILRHPRKKSKLLESPVELKPVTKSLSDQCFIGLFWGLVLTRFWIHMWLFSLLLPIPLAIWVIKKLGMSYLLDLLLSEFQSQFHMMGSYLTIVHI